MSGEDERTRAIRFHIEWFEVKLEPGVGIGLKIDLETPIDTKSIDNVGPNPPSRTVACLIHHCLNSVSSE
jgi:hypothetical protein